MRTINLYPDRLCDDTGKLCSPEHLCELAAALESGEDICLILFTPPVENTPYPQGSFGSFCRQGMLIWDYTSTEMQERYLGGLMTGKFFPGGRRLFEFPSVKMICLHDNFDAVQAPITACLRGEDPANFRESYLRHEEIFIGESGAVRDEMFDHKNICHIFMRHIMFTQPQIQHAFGNAAELYFCRCAEKVDPILAAPLNEALQSCFIPLQRRKI